MRKKIFLLVTLFSLQSAFAQHDKDKWHPFSNVPDLRYYVEGGSQFQQIEEQNAIMLGLKLGLTWNPNNAMGFTFGSTVNKFAPKFEPDTAVFLKNVLTGLYYEYMWRPNNVVHFTFPMAAGVGEVYYDWRELDEYGRASFPYDEKYYFYIEPAARVEVNLTNRWRVHGGLSYVYAPFDFNYRGVQSSSVSKPSFQIGIRYGKFFF